MQYLRRWADRHRPKRARLRAAIRRYRPTPFWWRRGTYGAHVPATGRRYWTDEGHDHRDQPGAVRGYRVDARPGQSLVVAKADRKTDPAALDNHRRQLRSTLVFFAA